MASIGDLKDPRARFFAYARERHSIYLRRASGKPRPWTQDPILQEFRFTNVFREFDKTTAWFRQHVRDPLRNKPEVLLATVAFRLLNRIEIGEAVFLQGVLDGGTAWEVYRDGGGAHKGDFCSTRILRQAIKAFCKKGPYVTGAYIISTPPGYKKLDGVMKIIEDFATRKCERTGCGYQDWMCGAKRMLDERGKITLEQTHEWLGGFPYLGKFHAYEIVTDLRHTALLDKAPDINSWANMGPGARRGLNRIHERSRSEIGAGSKRKLWGLPIEEKQAQKEMQVLLQQSRLVKYWPFTANAKTPAWEMRDVEHTLCEFDKYERVRTGEGRPRGVFK
jgi:hypothetical protein